MIGLIVSAMSVVASPGRGASPVLEAVEQSLPSRLRADVGQAPPQNPSPNLAVGGVLQRARHARSRFPSDLAQRKSRRARVSLAIKDADVRDVLTFLAKRGGDNIIMGDGVRGKVTLVLNDVTVAVAIATVVKVQGYVMSRHQNVTWVRAR